MGKTIVKKSLISTQVGRDSEIKIMTHDSVATLQILSSNPSSTRPSVNLDISSGGSLRIFKDEGSGWVDVRTI